LRSLSDSTLTEGTSLLFRRGGQKKDSFGGAGKRKGGKKRFPISHGAATCLKMVIEKGKRNSTLKKRDTAWEREGMVGREGDTNDHL